MDRSKNSTYLAEPFVRFVLRRSVRKAVRRGLCNRMLEFSDRQSTRWLVPEIDLFLGKLDNEVLRLRAHARLAELPNLGNRILVELAVYTTASDRVLRQCGVIPDCAHSLVADIGWDVYRRLLLFASLPYRLSTRDPGKRLQRTVRAVLRFPFKAQGAPGYAVKTWVDAGSIHTHFTHCPPWSLVQRISVSENDPDAAETFRQSWCRYDWPGADLIAGDGKRGHYSRPRTLSHGDSVCDMCWAAKTADQSDEHTEV